MTQDPQKDPKQQQNQPYDASLKGWISQQARAILPVLLPGAHYERTLNVEAVRPPMRVDKVFQVRYDEENYLLHLEFEVGYDRHLKSRLLVYQRLNMFEQLFNESPTIQKIREQYRVQFLEQGIQQGRQEGIQEGLQALQDLLVDNVQGRYPELAVLARTSASRFDQLDALKVLIQQVMIASNADAVRRLLQAGTA